MNTVKSQTFYKTGPLPLPTAQVLLSRHEAAARLSISVATLDRLTRAGELPRVKLLGKVLYRPESLDAFARQKETSLTAADASTGPAAQSPGNSSALVARQAHVHMPT
jgi:excisionase family DNA binding protein